jgi:hypothetical protein
MAMENKGSSDNLTTAASNILVT